MKKLILAAVVLSSSFVISCKKDRNCTCTITKTYGGIGTVNTTAIVYKSVSKKQAKTLCVSYTSTSDGGTLTTETCKLD